MLARRTVYPLMAVAVVGGILAAEYWPREVHVLPPVLAVAPPPYAATILHLPAADMAFADFLQLLRQQCPVPVKTLWQPAATSESAALSPPQTVHFPSITLAIADLPAALPARSCYVAFDPDALVLGDLDAIHGPLRAQIFTYPVADLVTPSYFSDDGLSTRQEDLVRLIELVAAPDTWRDMGGTLGSMTWFDTRLTVVTTPDIHYQIQSLLSTLRRR